MKELKYFNARDSVFDKNVKFQFLRINKIIDRRNDKTCKAVASPDRNFKSLDKSVPA